jgi:hypothetical protein
MGEHFIRLLRAELDAQEDSDHILRNVPSRHIVENITARLFPGYIQLRRLRKEIDREVMKTPTGPTRDLLTECAIVLSTIIDGKLLADSV